MTELKPCPFCGCRVYLSRDDGLWLYPEHPESDCIGYEMCRKHTIRQSRMGRAEFIEKWNRRSSE